MNQEPNTDAALAADFRREEAIKEAPEEIEEIWWNNLCQETRDNIVALIPDERKISDLFWEARKKNRLPDQLGEL